VITFLDCGAFPAFKRGGVISLPKYIEFIQADERHIDRYASLDVIPGDGVRTLNPTVVEQAAEQSYKNHRAMRDAGLTPIPIVHFGDDLHWLERLLDDGEPYIGLAPGGWSKLYAISFLDRCFRLISNAGRVVHTHGFAVTSVLLVSEYPWTSVDSSTWLQQGRFGQVLVPVYSDGEPDYRHAPRVVSVSDRAKRRANHIAGLGELEMEQTETFLRDEVGIDLEQVRNSGYARWRANAIYLHRMTLQHNVEGFFVVGDTRQQQTLRECGINRILVNYYDLQNRKSGLNDYVDQTDKNDMPLKMT
jgi:hypothetical protein